MKVDVSNCSIWEMWLAQPLLKTNGYRVEFDKGLNDKPRKAWLCHDSFKNEDVEMVMKTLPKMEWF